MAAKTTGKSPQKLAAERRAHEEARIASVRKIAASKAAEKRAESAEDVSKKVRDQVADAVALVHMAEYDKLGVGYNLADAFNLSGEDRSDFLSLITRHHSLVGT